MRTEYIEIIDFILSHLNEREANYGDDVGSIEHRYEKDTGKTTDHDFWKKIMRICQDKYLVSREHNSFLYRITPTGLEILIQYGSYLEYWKSQNIEHLENQEIKELQRKNLELQNRKLKRDIIFGIIGFVIATIITNWKDILILLKVLLQE